MRPTIKWDARDLEKGLRKLREETSSATARNAAKRGLIQAAQPMVDVAQNHARRRSGELADGIAAGTLAKNVGDAEYSAVLRSGGVKADAVKAMRDARRALKGSGPVAVVIAVGPTGRSASRAHLEEFGVKPHIIRGGAAAMLTWPDGVGGRVFAGAEVHHPGHAPHPFMRPAFEETADEVLSRIKGSIEAQIGAAAARAARKRARAARG